MTQKKQRPFGLRDKFSYMMGDVGCNMVLTLANSYLLVFYTKVMGVSAGIVSTLFMLARFVDAFTDMYVGRIVDTRGGSGDRYRPWIAYGSIPLVICSSLMYCYWLADAAMIIKVIWLIVTYLLFGSVCYTAVNIPYGVMSSVISNDPAHRASLSTWRSIGSTIGGAVLGIVIPLVIYTQDEAGNDVASGPRFFLVAVVMGVIALICLMICYFGSTERIHIANKTPDGSGRGNLKAILSCLKDRALLMNIGYCVFIYGATTVFSTFNQFMFLDYFGNTSMSGLASMMMLFGMLLAAPVATIFAKRIGKKELSIIGLTLSCVTYMVLFILRPSSVFIYFAGVLLAFLGIGIVTMVSYALMNDCIDNHYMTTGDRAGGTVYAMNSFMRKMAGALCTGIGGRGLVWIGYDELATVQTAAVKQGVFNLSVAIPLACFILALVFMVLFPLNKKKVEEVHAFMESQQKEETAENV